MSAVNGLQRYCNFCARQAFFSVFLIYYVFLCYWVGGVGTGFGVVVEICKATLVYIRFFDEICKEIVLAMFLI